MDVKLNTNMLSIESHGTLKARVAQQIIAFDQLLYYNVNFEQEKGVI